MTKIAIKQNDLDKKLNYLTKTSKSIKNLKDKK
jgi:hypothetical protein